MKKGLAFMIALVLVFGSFGFAFALGPGSESGIHSGNVNEKVLCELCQDLGLSSSDLILYSGDDQIIPDYLTWSGNNNTSGVLTNTGSKAVEIDHIIIKAGDEHYVVSFGTGNNILSAKGGTYTVINDKILNSNDKPKNISHVLVFGSVCEPPEETFTAEFNINKEVSILSGAPATKDFTFKVNVSGSAIEVKDQTITIPAGSTEGSVSVSIPDLKKDNFPFDLMITENGVNGGDWTYDGAEHIISVALKDGKVTYSCSNDPASVTFTNKFSGSYEIEIPIEKMAAGDGGFPDETFTFAATTTPGGAAVGTSSLTLTADGTEKGVINVKLPSGTQAPAFPVTLMVTENAGNNPSWQYDDTCYGVTVDLVTEGGLPTITNIKKMTNEDTMTVESTGEMDTIVFTNTYNAPITFEVPFTKNVDGEKYGSETFHFTAQLIPYGQVEAMMSDSATLDFANNMTTSTGKFEFELTGTQAGDWLPAQIEISEVAGNSAGWDYDQHVYWAQVAEDGTVSGEFKTEQSTASSITFTNKYEGEPIEIQIPIKKIGTVDKGTFKNQPFSFEVKVQDGEGWDALSGASITLAYPNAMSGTAILKFTEDQLKEYAETYGDPIVLKITENNGKANYWTYDETAYTVQINKDKDNGEWSWEIKDAKEIVFHNSYSYSGGSGTKDDSNKSINIEDNEIPIMEDPGDIDVVSIPEAEIPLTGGIGIIAFLAFGGATAAMGAGLRKKEKNSK